MLGQAEFDIVVAGVVFRVEVLARQTIVAERGISDSI
jgi:hypothetical protein